MEKVRMMHRKVVVTGLGIIAPGSIGAEEFWNNASEGKVFTGRLKAFDPEGSAVPFQRKLRKTGLSQF
jgi:3-oxoacyl-(acyl-carrier-protein) synthase